MPRVFVAIGTNLGDRHAHVRFAQHALDRLAQTRVIALSQVYETEPIGLAPQGKYLNAVALVETGLVPHRLLDALQRIEYQAGRQPQALRAKWGPRTLDLDILLYDRRVICSDQLVVPHPMMHRRWFVLKPLADLDPTAMHPLLDMTVGQLLARRERRQIAPSGMT